MSRGSAWSLAKGEACPPQQAGGGLGDPAARETGRGCRERDFPAARGRRGAGGPSSSLGRNHLPFSPAGSAPPGPVPEGLIRLYGMRFCPFAKRTLLVLKAKGIR